MRDIAEIQQELQMLIAKKAKIRPELEQLYSSSEMGRCMLGFTNDGLLQNIAQQEHYYQVKIDTLQWVLGNVNDSNRVADHYAEMYQQNKQQIGETDQDYRNRIAYYLRDNKNKILEGQSVLDNEFAKSNSDVNVRGDYPVINIINAPSTHAPSTQQASSKTIELVWCFEKVEKSQFVDINYVLPSFGDKVNEFNEVLKVIHTENRNGKMYIRLGRY